MESFLNLNTIFMGLSFHFLKDPMIMSGVTVMSSTVHVKMTTWMSLFTENGE